MMSASETVGSLELFEESPVENSNSLSGIASHAGGSAGSAGRSAGHISGAGGQSGGHGGQPGVAPTSTQGVAVLASNDVAGKAPGTGKPEGRGRRGCMPDVPDARDVHYVPPVDTATLPQSVDLR